MGAAAEGQVPGLVAGDVEPVGVLAVLGGVAASRAVGGEDGVMRRVW